METYDYIIVGAGSAGCVLARGLSENPHNRVLLLEAGPHTDRFWVHTPAGMSRLYRHEQLNWNYFTQAMPQLAGRKMFWPRGKGLGGSSSINGMIYIRGHARDFDGWKRLGNGGWGFEDVLPYFKQIEHNERGADAYRGAGGPLWVSEPALKAASSFDFIESAVGAGIPRSDDLNGSLHDGVGFLQHTIRNGKRQSAFVAFVKPVLARSNLVVRTGSLVQRVLFAKKQAVGVEVVVGGAKQVISARREVILAAGALNTPQLLKLSGVGPIAELQRHGIPVVHDLPGVGANLQDHFYVHTAFASTPASSYNASIRSWRKYLEGLRYVLTGRGYLALGASQVAAFVKSSAQAEYADLQITFRPVTFSFHADGRLDVDRGPGVGVSVCVLRPKSSGEVRLRSANPADPPMFFPNFLTRDEDVRAMVAGIRHIRRIMSTQPIARRVIHERLPGADADSDERILEYMAQTGNTASHQCGTCRMGRDGLAVVDERLRVHGLARLRVADASVMPHITSGNTNAPTLMIGAKAADMINQDAVPRRGVPA